MLASLIDRRLYRASMFAAVAAIAAFFGVIHSPMPGAPIQPPWRIGAASAGDSAPTLTKRAAKETSPSASAQADAVPALKRYITRTPYDYAASYGMLALLFAARGYWGRLRGEKAIDSDEEFEKTAAAV